MSDDTSSESTPTGESSDSKKIATSLGAISKSIDSIKESVSHIKAIEKSQENLTRKLHYMAEEQARTTTAITNTQQQITQLTELQQQSLKIQEKQLLEAKLTRIAAERTTIETRLIREIAQREEAGRLNQAYLSEFWHCLHLALCNVRDCPDILAKQLMLHTLNRRMVETQAAPADLQTIPEKLFASDTNKALIELTDFFLTKPQFEADELSEFKKLRESWIEAYGKIENLLTEVAHISDEISKKTRLLKEKSKSLETPRNKISRTLYDFFLRSHHQNKFEAYGAEVATLEERKNLMEQALASETSKRKHMTNALDQIQKSHPIIAPFQPWATPLISI